MKHKKAAFFLIYIIFTNSWQNIWAQNIGIGAVIPKRNLHLHSQTSFDVGLQITNSFTTEGTLSGTTLRLLNSDFVVQNNELNGTIAFATNNNTRMKINQDGQVNIGINPTPLFTKYKLGLFDNTMGNVALNIIQNASTGNNFGIDALHYSTSGAAIRGNTSGGGSGFTGGEILNAGVVGTASTSGYAIAAYAQNGASAIRAKMYDNSGYAINSEGALRFSGIGEALGKVLTTDDFGNANWAEPTNFWKVVSGSVFSGDYKIKPNIPNFLGFTDKVSLEIESVDDIEGILVKQNGGASGILVSQFSPAPAIKASASSTGPAIELENGSFKVSGSKPAAFQVTATGTNFISVPNTSWANDPTDILIVTHNGVSTNVITAVYVKFISGSWGIYTESGTNIPAGEIYNVLVIKR